MFVDRDNLSAATGEGISDMRPGISALGGREASAVARLEEPDRWLSTTNPTRRDRPAGQAAESKVAPFPAASDRTGGVGALRRRDRCESPTVCAAASVAPSRETKSAGFSRAGAPLD